MRVIFLKYFNDLVVGVGGMISKFVEEFGLRLQNNIDHHVNWVEK